MIAVGAATAQTGILTFLFFGHTQNAVYGFVHQIFLQIAVAVSQRRHVLPHLLDPAPPPPAPARRPAHRGLTGLLWDVGRLLYILVLPHMDLHSVYGPFEVSVSLMIWAFLTGLLLLAAPNIPPPATPCASPTRPTSKRRRRRKKPQSRIPVKRPIPERGSS